MTPEQFSRSVRAAAARRDWTEVERVCRAQAWCEIRATVVLRLAALAAQCRALAHKLTHRSASGGMAGPRGG